MILIGAHVVAKHETFGIANFFSIVFGHVLNIIKLRQFCKYAVEILMFCGKKDFIVEKTWIRPQNAGVDFGHSPRMSLIIAFAFLWDFVLRLPLAILFASFMAVTVSSLGVSRVIKKSSRFSPYSAYGFSSG